MEAVEFYLWEGKVCYREHGTEHVLTQCDRDIITYVLKTLEDFFPQTVKALDEVCEPYRRNKMFFDYRRVDTFIRCNFSEHDTLHFDIEHGVMHFEDVKCPRRGVCKNEGIICKPRLGTSIPPEEHKVAILYSKGNSAETIARILKKSVKTVKAQLLRTRNRLRLSRTRDLIKVYSVYNCFTS